MAKLIKEADKYKEPKYRHKKIDTSAVNITVGTKIYSGDKLYGTVIKESDLFYYIYSEEIKLKDEAEGYVYEPAEFLKSSLKEKVVKGILKINEDC